MIRLFSWLQEMGRSLRTPQAVFRAARDEMAGPAETAPGRFLSLPDDLEWQAPQRLKVGEHFFTSEAHLRQSQRADWAHCDPRLMEWAMRLVEHARRRGVPLYVHAALRGEVEQNDLKAKGRSRAAYPRSAHNIGEAVDIVHGVFHWDMTPQEWALVGVLGQRVLDRYNATLPVSNRLALEWGGKWKFWDPAHWEVADYRARIRRLPAVSPVHIMPRAYLRQRRI